MGFLSSLFQSGAPTPQVAGPPVATTSIPKELAPYYKDILGKAQALYNEKTAEGYKPYTGPTMADFTPEQQQAFTGIAGLQGQQAPIFDEAMNLTRSAATPMTQEQMTTYMSPYQQAVTDIEKREATKQYESQVVPQLAAKAAMTQPFGGSRQAILEGMAADTQQRLLGDIQAKGSAQGYQDAVSRFNVDRLAQGQAGAQLAQMAPNQYKAQLGEYGALQTIGEEKQKQSQTALDEAFRQYTLEQNYPYDTMSKYQATVTGAPLGKTEFAKPAPPSPSLGQQLIGGLGGVGNLYGAFTGKTIGGQPYQQAKHGGGLSTLIKRAKNGPANNKVEDLTIQNWEVPPKETASNAPMVNKYLRSLSDVELANTRARDLQIKNEKLAKQQVDYQKGLLKADKSNAQFNREQALFSAMSGMGIDQDVANVQGVGQLLTMLAKVGPKVGASEKEQRANIRESEKSLIDLEMQYNQALATGDMTRAMQLSEVMKGGAGVEIDIGTLNATLAKNNLESTFKMLDLAKVSAPAQKTMQAAAANMLGYSAIFDENNNLRVSKSGEPLLAGDQVALSRVEGILQKIYDAELARNSNQTTALTAALNYVLPDNINIPNVSGKIVTPNKDYNVNQSIKNKLIPGIIE
jgi:hypothetical protein